MQNPILLVVTLLNIGVIIVNGATDAPNAIATAVSTRAMKPRHAIIMAAVFNFLGLLLVSLVSTAVAHTIFSMVDFGGNSHQALTALMAAMVAIIVWGAAAWWFGIPTSQVPLAHRRPHRRGHRRPGRPRRGINGAEWMKVIYGIVLSIGCWASAWAGSTCKLIALLFAACQPAKCRTSFFKCAQICCGAAAMSFHARRAGRPEVHRRASF